MAPRKSSVTARRGTRSKCSRSNAGWAAFRAANSMSAAVNQLAGFHKTPDGHSLVGDLLHVPLPDRFAGLVVRRAHGKQVVEPPRPEKAGSCLPTSFVALPAAIVITCEHDPLRGQGEASAERLREAGVPVTARREQGMIHNFMILDTISPACAAAADRVAADLKAALSPPSF